MGTKQSVNGSKPKTRRSIVAPIVVTEEGRTQMVIEMLGNIQAQRFRLEVQMVANNHNLESNMPLSVQEVQAEVPATTYEEKISQLTEAEQRICQAYEDVIPHINSMLENSQGQ